MKFKACGKNNVYDILERLANEFCDFGNLDE